MTNKPTLKTSQIWNLNLGFLGLQIAFSLLVTNTSRIFSALGAQTDLLSVLWLAPPLAGLIIQPIIGYWSDRKWTRFGRRIPFIFIGSVVSFFLLILIPNLSADIDIFHTIWDEVLLLFLLQVAFNATMLPFRSLVGDMLNPDQQNEGFSVQTLISNTGGIVGSMLPFVLAFWGVRNEPEGSERLAPSLSWSFYIGAILLIITVLWTCFKTKEYKPLCEVRHKKESIEVLGKTRRLDSRKTIFELGLIQFFSWIAFFFLWVYATDGIAKKIWNTQNPLSEAYNEAGNWFGVLSAFYSVVAILLATILSRLAKRYGRKQIYFVSLICASLGFYSFYYIDNQYMLLLPMLGIGIGWASILTFPFAIMASKTDSKQMGLQMGLLNITITFPQIIGAISGMFIFKYWAKSDSMTMILFAGIALFVAALFVLRLNDNVKKEKVKS